MLSSYLRGPGNWSISESLFRQFTRLACKRLVLLRRQVTDVIDKLNRSQVMASIRGRGNRSTEPAMVQLLREARTVGCRPHVELRPKLTAEDIECSAGRNASRIRTRPDFVFRSVKGALFVDGCFWHGCPLHSTAPLQNAKFWSAKLSRNVQRDRVQMLALENAGWRVIRVWEHELRDHDALKKRLVRVLRRSLA